MDLEKDIETSLKSNCLNRGRNSCVNRPVAISSDIRYKRRATVSFVTQVRYGGIRRCSASPRPPCDGTPSASVWPSPRQTPGPPCPYPSDRTTPDASMKRVGAPAWTRTVRPCTGRIHHGRQLKATGWQMEDKWFVDRCFNPVESHSADGRYLGRSERGGV